MNPASHEEPKGSAPSSPRKGSAAASPSKFQNNVQHMFGQIGFVRKKESPSRSSSFLPVLIISPLQVPESNWIRASWIHLMESSQRGGQNSVPFLVCNYGIESNNDDQFAIRQRDEFVPYTHATQEMREFATEAFLKQCEGVELSLEDQRCLRAKEEMDKDLKKPTDQRRGACKVSIRDITHNQGSASSPRPAQQQQPQYQARVEECTTHPPTPAKTQTRDTPPKSGASLLPAARGKPSSEETGAKSTKASEARASSVSTTQQAAKQTSQHNQTPEIAFSSPSFKREKTKTSDNIELVIPQRPTSTPVAKTQTAEDVKDPQDYDVLIGRGVQYHRGNLNFQSVVDHNKPKYAAGNNAEKNSVVKKVVKAWRQQEPPGRFLKLDERRKTWYEVDIDAEAQAREWIMRLLREKQPPDAVSHTPPQNKRRVTLDGETKEPKNKVSNEMEKKRARASSQSTLDFCPKIQKKARTDLMTPSRAKAASSSSATTKKDPRASKADSPAASEDTPTHEETRSVRTDLMTPPRAKASSSSFTKKDPPAPQANSPAASEDTPTHEETRPITQEEYKARIQSMKKKNKSLLKALRDEKEKTVALQSEVDDGKTLLQYEKGKTASLSSELDVRKKLLTAEQKTNSGLQSELAENKKLLQDSKEKTANLLSELDESKMFFENEKEKNSALQSELEESKSSSARKLERLQKIHERDVRQIKGSRISEHDKQVADLKRQLELIKMERDEARSKLQQCQVSPIQSLKQEPVSPESDSESFHSAKLEDESENDESDLAHPTFQKAYASSPMISEQPPNTVSESEDGSAHKKRCTGNQKKYPSAKEEEAMIFV